MEIVVPAVLIEAKRISISPQLETIFEEIDFENSNFYEIFSWIGECVLYPKVLRSLKLK